jgi:hypothetical protein
MREIRETIDLVFVKQEAFRPKRTFLKQTPMARRIAHATLGSETLMRPRPLKRGVKAAMEIMACAPAYAFILQQRWWRRWSCSNHASVDVYGLYGR